MKKIIKNLFSTFDHIISRYFFRVLLKIFILFFVFLVDMLISYQTGNQISLKYGLTYDMILPSPHLLHLKLKKKTPLRTKVKVCLPPALAVFAINRFLPYRACTLFITPRIRCHTILYICKNI